MWQVEHVDDMSLMMAWLMFQMVRMGRSLAKMVMSLGRPASACLGELVSLLTWIEDWEREDMLMKLEGMSRLKPFAFFWGSYVSEVLLMGSFGDIWQLRQVCAPVWLVPMGCPYWGNPSSG